MSVSFRHDPRHLIPPPRRTAAVKARLVREFCQYAIVVGLLFVFSKTIAFLVGLVWGAHLVGEFVKKLLEPSLRQHWVQKDVQRELAGRVGRERREIQDQHTRSIETLSASIAHEIRSPITAARSLVQQMGEDPRADQNVEVAEVALEELDRVERSISHLLRYAREEELSLSPLEMADVVESSLAVLRERVGRIGLRVEKDLDDRGFMHGDREKLRRVLINLVANALDALEEAKTPDPVLDVAVGQNLAGTEVWVRVRDNGPGIGPEAMEKIFSPFYTSKNEGTGLGLAVSKKLVEAHGGSMEAHSTPGDGTELVLTFPRRPGPDPSSQ